MPKCFLVVRALIADAAQRSAFDDWYRGEHLPQAMEAFSAEKGWRFWSETDPSVHQATYQFADRAAADRAMNSDGMKALIAEFDRRFPGVTRTREIFTLVEERDGSGQSPHDAAMSQQVIGAALDKAAAMLVAQPQSACRKNAPATASYDGGLKFSISGPNGEEAESDMPGGVGGSGSAPAPGWMLRAALASCTGSLIAMRAAKLGIAIDKLDVQVDSDSDDRGLLGLDDSVSAGLSNLRASVRIRSQGVQAAELEALVRWADRHSPVSCTLRPALAQDIDIVVE
jgi:uncharacterized OsmC-like protein